MIKDNTILSSFDERPTLLEWLKKVEQDQGDTVKQVAIENGNLVVTFVSGKTEIVGPVGGDNPYADIILINRDTNTTKIVNNVEVGGKLQVSGEASISGNVAMGGNLGVTGQATVGRGLSVVGALSATGAIQTDVDVIIAGVSIDDKISSAINSAITSTLEAEY